MTGRVSATLANTADGVTPTGPASSSHRDEGPQLCALGPRLCLTRVCGSPSLSRSRVGRPPSTLEQSVNGKPRTQRTLPFKKICPSGPPRNSEISRLTCRGHSPPTPHFSNNSSY